ncbi:MAG: PEGA domain-containing protein [Tenuifilaceae bacterium]|nr:PEGA domain-containing protein [Tenuifilaceae bacterium]
MKSFSLLLLALSIAFISYSQNINVKSFRLLENDLDARVHSPKRDQNNEVCAIIKVVTTQTGFSFDVGSLGVVSTVQKKGEIWVYVPRGVQRITITHSQLGVLRNYPFNISIQTATVYEMVLTTARVTTVVQEPEIESQWLIITSEPEEANIFIDDMMVGRTPFQRRYREGQYSYRIEFPRYHTQAGSITIEGDKQRIDALLKPNFGNILVTSSPENGMAVYLNDRHTGKTTPVTLVDILSGEHVIRVIDSWYQPQAKRVTVNDEDTTSVNFEMRPAFANITINCSPGASILLDDEFKSIEKWTGRLLAGVYNIKVEKENHYSQSRKIEVFSEKDQTIDFNLMPKIGSIDVVTLPIDAEVLIDNKNYGKTPLTVKDLIIGEYNLQISKEGYGTFNKRIIIEEGETLSIEENLPDGMEVTINSVPSNSLVTINGTQKGYTPLSTTLGYGKHQVTVEKMNEYASKEIDVTENSTNNFTITIEGEGADWQKIVNSNNLFAFEGYKSKYPNSKHIDQVNERIFYLKAIQKKEIKFYEDYFTNYPNGASINEISDFMQNHYIKEGDKFYNNNYYSLAVVNYNKYIKYFPNGSEYKYASKQLSEIGNTEIKQTKAKIKQDKKQQRINKQTDAIFILYSYDNESKFGLGLGRLKNQNSGWYLNLKTNNFWKGKLEWFIDEQDPDYYSSSDTGKDYKWNCYLSYGLTYKVFSPLWVYGGLGLGRSITMDQHDLDSSYDDSSINNLGLELFAEGGLLLKVSILAFKYGLFYDLSGERALLHQFGIGIAF